MSAHIASLGLVSAIAVLTLSGPSPAAAHGTPEQRNACMGGAFRLCAMHIPDHKRIEMCLRTNRRDLSPACRRVVFGAPRPAREARD
jgi:hypothetical protein